MEPGYPRDWIQSFGRIATSLALYLLICRYGLDGSVRDPPVLAPYTVERTALDRSRRTRLQRRCHVLSRQADPIQPFHLASVCGRGNRMSTSAPSYGTL